MNYKKLVSVLSLVFLFAMCFVLFAGCESANKEEIFVYIDHDNITYNYDSRTNQTIIIFGATIENNTIFNLFGLNFEIQLTSIDNADSVAERLNYELLVKHGQTSKNKFRYEAYGNISAIDFVAKQESMQNFWQTYNVWIIVIGVIVLCVVIVSSFFEIDMVEFVESALWWVGAILGSLFVLLIIITSWVNVLLVLAGVVVAVLLIAVIQAIKDAVY